MPEAIQNPCKKYNKNPCKSTTKMPAKRGRPLSSDVSNPDATAFRKKENVRLRRFRGKPPQSTEVVPQTEPQLRQAEAITERLSTDIDVAQTVPGLGLRVRYMTLDQDPSDAQLQQQAVHIEEHNTLYDEDLGPT